MFEKPNVSNNNESVPTDIENEKKYQEYLALKESAPREAAALITESVDESLQGEERHQALVALMERLNEENPQRYRMVIELIAQVTKLEEMERKFDENRTRYSQAATLTQKAA